MDEQVKLVDRRSLVLLLAVTWVTYFSIYLGRLNLSASLSAMVAEDGYAKSELGMVAAAFFFAYGAGQVFSGYLGDRLSPRYLVLGGLGGASLFNFLFAAAASPRVMTLLWLGNGLCQSLIWAPMFRYLSDLTFGPQCVRIVLLLSTSGPAGMLCAYGVSAALIGRSGWQACFVFGGCAVLAAAGVWFGGGLWVDRRARRHGIFPVGNEKEKANPPGPLRSPGGNPLALAAGSGFLLIVAGACLHGLLKDGLTTWIPTYLTEVCGVSPSSSVLLTTLLPVVNLSGVFLANRGNRRLFGNEAISGLCWFAVSLAALAGLLFAGGWVAATVALFAIITSAMTAANTIFVSLVPLHFRRMGMVSTVSGLLGAVTYGGSALSSALYGNAAEHWGWGPTQGSWVAIAALGALCCALAAGKWRRFREDIYSGV